uniref:Serine/threonine-protein phosphatase PGAM5, mitochondrial n=1 Tax=Aceria tosichella TaxID=561515 RepID=A0A6G1SMS7_9ACAR
MSMFRGVTKLVIGVGFAGACSGYTLHMLAGPRDTKAVQASSSTLGESKLFDYLVKNPHEFNPNLPKTSWDYDWDKRDPASLVPPGQSMKSDEDIKRQTRISTPIKPTATRHLFLIRHGQYNLKGATDEERTLTPLGWEQAEFTAKRLKELSIPYAKIIQSSMTRAKNTASVISKHLGDVPVETCDFLREGAPIKPVPESGNWRPEAQFHEDGARIEAAFRRYFYRADPSQTEDSYEILACHANVIRYFVCRALQFPPEAWLRFSLHNCSITWVAIRPSGRITVYSIGDSGHLPPHVLTTT